MSTDLASSRVFPDSLYKLRVDCEREIDFDFFDDAPSAPTTPSWSQRGAGDSRTRLGDSDADRGLDLDDGNVPSPTLVGGPTPIDSSSSGSSGLSSSASLASSLNEGGRPGRPTPGDIGGRPDRLDPAEDAVKDAVKEAAKEDHREVSAEHAEDDVVVARVTSSEQQQASADAGRGAPPTPPLAASAAASPSQDERVAKDAEDTEPASDAVPVNGILGEAAPPRTSVPEASTTSSPSTSSSPSSSEDSDDSDDDSAEDAVEDVEEAVDADATFGIQELSLTVSHKPHRALSSMTVSSMTAVSSMARGDSAGDSDPEDAYTMDAIKKALRRARPPSSTGSLPVMAPGRPGVPGRSRRLNMSFSNDDARRIQRENELLLRRIVSQRARQPMFGPVQPPAQPPSLGRAGRASPAPTAAHRCSHAVNRARRGKDIERDNQILLKKIQSVKRSPSQLSMSRSSSSMSGRYSYG